MGAPAYPSPCCKARSEARRILSDDDPRIFFRCCACGALWIYEYGRIQRPRLVIVRDPEETGT